MPSFARMIFLFAFEIALVQTSSGRSPATQSEVAENYVPTITYDVASVRRTNPDYSKMVRVGGDFQPSQCFLRVENEHFVNLLFFAYGVTLDQVSGISKAGPDAVAFDTYNIQSKCDEAGTAKLATLSKPQQRLEQEHMVQALLTDRFRLKVHWETREGATYALVLAKRGRLHESAGEPPSAEERTKFAGRPIPAIYQRSDGTGYDYVAHGASMKDLVQVLTSQMGRQVYDDTGLSGRYDFVLKYRGRTDADRPSDDQDPTPPLDRAVQEQLGLKVSRSTGPLKVLVIDHFENPTEN